MMDIKEWLENKGDNIIYVYGRNDPITACAVEPSERTNSILIIQNGANHNLRIEELDAQRKVWELLKEWIEE